MPRKPKVAIPDNPPQDDSKELLNPALQQRLEEMQMRIISRRAKDVKISKIQLERDIETLCDMMGTVLSVTALVYGMYLSAKEHK